jgi:hypothetical protein
MERPFDEFAKQRADILLRAENDRACEEIRAMFRHLEARAEYDKKHLTDINPSLQ